ncbi:hypothetical protein TNCV_4332731 [Trichonephila clavipes]|nr:hypothetical protein TNCV_4332731 [Trichonephila clavipes]
MTEKCHVNMIHSLVYYRETGILTNIKNCRGCCWSRNKCYFRPGIQSKKQDLFNVDQDKVFHGIPLQIIVDISCKLLFQTEQPKRGGFQESFLSNRTATDVYSLKARHRTRLQESGLLSIEHGCKVIGAKDCFRKSPNSVRIMTPDVF